MKQHIINSYKATIRSARIAYHTAAIVSIATVAFGVYNLSQGKLVKFDGVAHYEMPFGDPQQAMVAAIPADQMLPSQVYANPIPKESQLPKVAGAAPLPQHKPEPPKFR